MAVCGCGTGVGCTCVISGDKGINVGRDPAQGIDFILTLDLTSGTPAAVAGCNEVMKCVGTHIKDGLNWDPTTNDITVKIDKGYADNGITVTADGLYVPRCPPSGVCGGNFLVADLPATGVLCGYEGTGALTNPLWTREMMSLGHAHADTPLIFTITPVELVDGTLWWQNPTGNTQALSQFNQYDWNASTDLAKTYGQQVSLVHYSLDNSIATNVNAFCGALQPGEEAISVNDLLGRLGGIAILRFRFGSLSTAGRLRLQNMIQKMGLTKSVMLVGGLTTGSSERQTLKDWASKGGISAGGLVTQSAADAAVADASAIHADGITWIYVHHSVSDATITQLKNNGFVTMLLADNQYGGLVANGNRVRDLGLKGMCSWDPFYSLMPQRNYDMRSTVSPWRGGKFAPGMYTGRLLTYFDALNCPIRGTFVPDPLCQFTPTTDTWFQMNRALGPNGQMSYTLQGWAYQAPNPVMTMTGVLRFSGTPSPDTNNQWMGIGFSMSSDVGFSAGVPSAQGFILWITGNGEAFLNRINTSGINTPVGVTVNPNVSGEVAFTVSTTATTVSASVQAFGGSVLTIANNVADSNPRGGHLYTLYKPSTANNATWDARFRNFVITAA